MTFGEGGSAFCFVLLALLSLVVSEKAYTSEYAFNRAFSRTHGTPPGRYRHTARTQTRDHTAPARRPTPPGS